nr:unnamed protein product [Naegleria fowleri]
MNGKPAFRASAELENIKGYGSPPNSKNSNIGVDTPLNVSPTVPPVTDSSLQMSFNDLSESEKEVILNLLTNVPDSFLSFSKEQGTNTVKIVYKSGSDPTTERNTSKVSSSCNNSNGSDTSRKTMRSLDWALRLLDDIYNARYQCFLSEIASPDGTLEAFSSFVFNHLSKKLGLESLVKQTTTELLECVKYYREENKQLELFGLFLTPYYSAVDLMFFLYCRSQVINECIEGDRIPYVNRYKRVKLGVVPHYVPLPRLAYLIKRSLRDQPRQLVSNCTNEFKKLLSKKKKKDQKKKDSRFCREENIELYEFLIILLVNYKAFRESKNSANQYFFYTILPEEVPSYNRIRNKDLLPYIVLRETSFFKGFKTSKRLADSTGKDIVLKGDASYNNVLLDLNTEADMMEQRKQRKQERQNKLDITSEENDLMTAFLTNTSTIISPALSGSKRGKLGTLLVEEAVKAEKNDSLVKELSNLPLDDLLDHLSHSNTFEESLRSSNNFNNIITDFSDLQIHEEEDEEDEETLLQQLQETIAKIEKKRFKKAVSDSLEDEFKDHLLRRSSSLSATNHSSLNDQDSSSYQDLESISIGEGYELDDEFIDGDEEHHIYHEKEHTLKQLKEKLPRKDVYELREEEDIVPPSPAHSRIPQEVTQQASPAVSGIALLSPPISPNCNQ